MKILRVYVHFWLKALLAGWKESWWQMIIDTETGLIFNFFVNYGGFSKWRPFFSKWPPFWTGSALKLRVIMSWMRFSSNHFTACVHFSLSFEFNVFKHAHGGKNNKRNDIQIGRHFEPEVKYIETGRTCWIFYCWLFTCSISSIELSILSVVALVCATAQSSAFQGGLCTGTAPGTPFLASAQQQFSAWLCSIW